MKSPTVTGLFFLFSSFFVSAQEKEVFEVDIDDPVQVLSKYISIPSITRNEGNAGRFIADVCMKKGLNINIFYDNDTNFNFAASLYPLSLKKPNIILMNHIDVVPDGNFSAWTYDPFKGIVADSMIWGRGAIDCKGLAVMQLMALAELVDSAKTHDLPYNFTFLAVSGEELAGNSGAKQVLNSFPEDLNPVAVYGEGGAGFTGAVPSKPNITVFGISLAEKSNLWLKLELKFNSSGHGATPPKEYVNQVMLEALSKLGSRKKKYVFTPLTKEMFKQYGKLEGGFKGFVLRNINWLIFRRAVRNYFSSEPLLESLVTNTIIFTNFNNPPGPPNQISDEVTVLLDCRLLPTDDKLILPDANRKRFIRQLQNILKEQRIQISVIDEGVQAEPSKMGKFYKALEEAVGDNYPDAAVVPILFPATTDNSYFRCRGIPVYGLVPAALTQELISTVHNVNERLPVHALESGINTYRTLLYKLIDDKEAKRWFKKGFKLKQAKN